MCGHSRSLLDLPHTAEFCLKTPLRTTDTSPHLGPKVALKETKKKKKTVKGAKLLPSLGFRSIKLLSFLNPLPPFLFSLYPPSFLSASTSFYSSASSFHHLPPLPPPSRALLSCAESLSSRLQKSGDSFTLYQTCMPERRRAGRRETRRKEERKGDVGGGGGGERGGGSFPFNPP